VRSGPEDIKFISLIMTFLQRNKSLTLTLLFILSVNHILSGQADTTKTAKTENSKKADTVIKDHTLFATAGYGSNMIFLGATISQNQPFYATGLVYGFKNSFYLSASATHIQGLDPFVAYYNAAVYYKHTFNSWFDISADVSGYKTAPSLEQTLFDEFIFANFTSGFDWKILYTRLSAGALFSSKTSGFIQLSNSRYFQTPEFFKGKSYVSFNPEINMLFGDVIYMKTTSGASTLSYSTPFHHKRRDPPPPVISYTEKFGPMNFEFSLPVTFNYSKLSIEANPCYILPAYTKNLYQVPNGFTIYVTASIRFF
jgi:hypothetical protein